MNTYVYVLDTFADWELSYAMAELETGRFFRNRDERLPVRTVGASKAPIRTMGGLTVVPDMSIEELSPETVRVLLLPGADHWSDPRHRPVLKLAGEVLEKGGVVAAICGATGALAEAGLLDSRPHTSNALEYLTMFCPNYKGSAHYRDEAVVSDGNLITAGSTDGLPLAREILNRLGVCAGETLQAWYDFFRTGEARYYYGLMASLGGETEAG